MKKDHPWSRAGRIVTRHRASIHSTTWNSTFQKMARIALEKMGHPRYSMPGGVFSRRRGWTTGSRFHAFRHGNQSLENLFIYESLRALILESNPSKSPFQRFASETGMTGIYIVANHRARKPIIIIRLRNIQRFWRESMRNPRSRRRPPCFCDERLCVR